MEKKIIATTVGWLASGVAQQWARRQGLPAPAAWLLSALVGTTVTAAIMRI